MQSDNLEFSGRVAVVTGASSGIGRATAQILAERGAKVVLVARSAGKLEDVATAYPDVMHVVSGDASEVRDVARAFEECESRFGTCDLLVCAAGMIEPKALADTTAEMWDRMFAVNVRGVYLAARRALPGMLAARRGTIVNVASISGVPGPQKFPGFVSYCASKAAVVSLTEALAAELAGSGVRVNCVSPGSVDTPMWAEASGGAPAAMTAAEVAESILFLASDRSRPMNGQNLDVYSS